MSTQGREHSGTALAPREKDRETGLVSALQRFDTALRYDVEAMLLLRLSQI